MEHLSRRAYASGGRSNPVKVPTDRSPSHPCIDLSAVQPGEDLFDGRLVAFRDIVPIHEIVDEGLEIIGPEIAIVD
jgi:hypothetical protein